MKKIKWGIIATGRIAHSFASDFQFVEKGKLVAVASRNIESARKFAAEFKIPNTYGSYEALIEDPDVDAVYVATPHNSHFEISSQLLRAGKAVLCEKPITINAAECKQLIDLARSENGYIMEALWTYFLPAIQKAQEWVTERKIGEVRHIRADFGFPKPYEPEGRLHNPKLAGGALLDMGIYPIAMAWLFLRKNPLHIHVINRNAPSGVDDEVSLQFDYGDEAATLNTSFRSKLYNHLVVVGTDGYIHVPDFWQAKGCLLIDGEDNCLEHFNDGRTSLGFNYEADAVNSDLIAGRSESETMPHAYSLTLQEQMDRVRSKFT